MQSLKEPGTVISAATLTGLVGASVYFYRRTSALQEELTKVSDGATGTTKKVGALAGVCDSALNMINQANERIDGVDAQLTACKESLDELLLQVGTHTEILADYRDLLTKLLAYLKDKDAAMNIQMPRKRTIKKTTKKAARVSFSKVRPGKRRPAKEESSDEEDPEDSSEEDEESSEEDVKSRKGKGKAKQVTPAKGRKKSTVATEGSDDDDEEDVKAQIAAAKAARNKKN